MITLYDADRCPFCARTRIVLAEKGLEFETVTVDLDDRPAWLREKNPLNKVPVLEEDTLCLPESAVINEYLEERYPEPALLPADPAERALARQIVWQFDDVFGDDYYSLRRNEVGAAERFVRRLEDLDILLVGRAYLTGSEYGLADVAYFPWLPRAEALLGVDLSEFRAVYEWIERLSERPAIAAELEVVAALPR
jgi:RNA polymerase-associated protein